MTDAVRSSILSDKRPDGPHRHTDSTAHKPRRRPAARPWLCPLPARRDQVLNVTTLGPLADAQRLDTLTPVETKRYLHHYNFPPYSVGEAAAVLARRAAVKSAMARSQSGRSCQ